MEHPRIPGYQGPPPSPECHKLMRLLDQPYLIGFRLSRELGPNGIAKDYWSVLEPPFLKVQDTRLSQLKPATMEDIKTALKSTNPYKDYCARRWRWENQRYINNTFQYEILPHLLAVSYIATLDGIIATYHDLGKKASLDISDLTRIIELGFQGFGIIYGNGSKKERRKNSLLNKS